MVEWTKLHRGETPFLLTNNYIMKETQILKEVFTTKNILLGILFNLCSFGSMYGFLEIILYLRYDLGWI
tara:strand:- start:7842 stop:8048 length:207 start_codon:yes stop_codon:yes gene_type:complete